MKRLSFWRILVFVCGSLLLLFLSLPILALILTTTPNEFWQGLNHPMVIPALKLSLFTSFTSLSIVIVFGTALAWTLAQKDAIKTHGIESWIQLPIMIPPAVAGVALLLAFGRKGLLGPWLEQMHLTVSFTTAAVVLASVFVSSSFYIQAATVAFRRVDLDLIHVARSLGASPIRTFFRVVLPLSKFGLLNGAAMSWARSLGEFGATLMFAGNLMGKTQTLPLAIYTGMESDLKVAQSISIVLVVISFALLLSLRALTMAYRRRQPRERIA